MNYERYEDWVRVSYKWIRDTDRDLGLPYHIQLLGIEDAELRYVDRSLLFDSDGNAHQDENGILLVERYQIKAHLWVLGVYEVIRMLSQRVREEPNLTVPKAVEVIHATKKNFERLRVPLAKLEASNRHRLTDYPTARPGLHGDRMAWKVSDDCVLTQRELSDQFHKMLTTLRAPETKHEV